MVPASCGLVPRLTTRIFVTIVGLLPTQIIVATPQFDFPPRFPYVPAIQDVILRFKAFSHMGVSFPGGVEASIRQRVSLPGVVSSGLRFGTEIQSPSPVRRMGEGGRRPDEGSFFA